MTTKRFNILYLIYFIGMGIYYPFIGVYLENYLGFTGSQIGTILGAGPIIMMISLPLFGIIADKTEQPRRIVLILSILASSIIALMNFNSAFIAVFFIIILFEFFKGPTMNLIDSITMKVTKEHKFNYSGIRTFGSLGYILGSLVIGYFIKDLGIKSIFIIIPLILTISGIIVISFPYVKVKEKVAFKSEVFKLLINKNFIFITLIACLTYVTSDIENAYNGIYITHLGGTLTHVGFATLFTVFFELFLMRYNKKLLKKFGLKKILYLAILSVLIRYTVSVFASSVWMFYLAISMHGISVALIIPTALFYISEIVPDKLGATSITIYGAIIALIRALLTFSTGYVYEMYNLKVAYVAAGILGLVAIFLVMGLKTVKE